LTGTDGPSTRTFRVVTADGLALRARWDLPDDPAAAVVFCHPHPQYGGTMNAPLMQRVAAIVRQRGLAVLRFNFRGVAGSEGEWEEGSGEVADVEAAVETARRVFPDLPLGLAGWSFGAALALRWQADRGDASPYVGIAPPVASDLTPVLPEPARLVEAPRTFILGDRDQFIRVDDLRMYADRIGARLSVLHGSDHFFYFREDKVGALVADALTAGTGSETQ
jgi:alpha/beta superfamily hydrolase